MGHSIAEKVLRNGIPMVLLDTTYARSSVEYLFIPFYCHKIKPLM